MEPFLHLMQHIKKIISNSTGILLQEISIILKLREVLMVRNMKESG